MKKKLSTLIITAGLVATSFVMTGCVSGKGSIVLVKTTTLGFDVSGDPQTSIPHVRLGLVRNFYQVIPVSTNQEYAPSYATSVNAQMGLTSQYGNEDFATGSAADLLTGTTNLNTAAKIGATAKLAAPVVFASPVTNAVP